MTGAASAMGRNTESPAHGIWTAEGGAFTSLFEVLSFDECGELTGVVRVRTRIRMDGFDRITGEAVVDVIPTGEAPQSDVDAAVFEGVRIKL